MVIILFFGGVKLKNTFSRRFDLSINKMITVAKMYALGWGKRVKLGDGGVGY